MRIFHVDDGADWWLAAEDHADAISRWVQNHVELNGYVSLAGVVEDFGEPEARVVQPTEAAGIKVRSDDETDCCSTCGGTGRVDHYDSLLLVFNKDQELPPKKRARNGVLCCSEW